MCSRQRNKEKLAESVGEIYDFQLFIICFVFFCSGLFISDSILLTEDISFISN